MTAGSIALVVIWAVFWATDLHAARFQLVLACIPLGGIGLALVLRRRGFWRPFAAGAILGLALVWVLMVRRADNGCTGVSRIYELTLLCTAVFLFALGPGILRECCGSRSS
jgi:hypothetical protein